MARTRTLTMSLDRSLSPRALLVAALVIVLHAVALSVLDHAHRKRPIDLIVQNRPLVVTLMHAAPVPATPAPPVAHPAPPAPVAPAVRAEPPPPAPVISRTVAPPPVHTRPRVAPRPRPQRTHTPVEPAAQVPAPVAQPSAAPAPPAEAAAAPAPAQTPPPALKAPAPAARPGRGGAARLDCPAIEPAYPPLSARRGETGKVVIRLSIDAQGHVADAQVKSSSGFPRLDEAARDAALKLTCTPAISQGAPVAATGDRAYTFKLGQ